MNLKFVLSILCWNMCFFFTTQLEAQSYVTYEINSGRLGDRLVAYMHAKWLSYKYGLTLLYRPFEYSDKLMLSDIEKPFSQDLVFSRVIQPNQGENPDYTNKDNILFDIQYFPECKEEFSWRYRFEMDFQDAQFKELLRQAINPKIELKTIDLPNDCINLAVQVRKNSGGYDDPLSYEVIEKLGYLPDGHYHDYELPLKFPSDDYYIEQIKRASEFFNHKKIYLFIFTDDPMPKRIIDKYQEALKDYKNITFDYRKTENAHYLNVLEDLFSIIKFDAFIRSASNLGITASIIGNFKLVISPKHYQKIGKKIVIDEIYMETP